MKEKLLWFANASLFAVTLFLLGSFQTAFWFQLMGSFTGPVFWIPGLAYIALHRSTLSAVVVITMISLLLSTLTAIPDGMLLMVCLGLGLTTQIFKQRIYWSTSSYFMMICGIDALLFNVYHWLASIAIDDYSWQNPAWTDWLLQALLTPLIAPFLYSLFSWYDRVTQIEQSSQSTAQSL